MGEGDGVGGGLVSLSRRWGAAGLQRGMHWTRKEEEEFLVAVVSEPSPSFSIFSTLSLFLTLSHSFSPHTETLKCAVMATSTLCTWPWAPPVASASNRPCPS